MKKLFVILPLVAASYLSAVQSGLDTRTGVTIIDRLVPAKPVSHTEQVRFTTTITSSSTLSSTLTVQGESTVTCTNNGTAITGQESSVTTVTLRPGESYPMTMAGSVSSGTGAYELSFTAPQGYTVYIDDQPVDLSVNSVSGTYSDDHTIEIRPNVASCGGPWGTFSGISIGQSLTWSVGLGDLRTGRSAGGIQFNELDLTNSPATRDRLFYYAPAANVGQIVVVYDGPSSQRLRQICAPGGFTDLVDITGGYEIRCYTWSQATWTGTMYTFTGSPWKTIKVESPASNQLKITETQGSLVHVSKLTGTGTVVATGATGGDSIVTTGGYTIHTFNSSGTFTVGSGISTVDYLVVGGGGGGGGSVGGGGGGGGVATGTVSVSAQAYGITVGAGGAGGALFAAGSSGGNSVFNGITAIGGGGGAHSGSGVSGGSGGGGAQNTAGGGAGTGGQGNSGGAGEAGPNYCGGGGGGGGAAGANATTIDGGNGGNGYSSSITGTAASYGGGGGGGKWGPSGVAGLAGSGGTGGGGAGSNDVSNPSVAGTANTGGGGGGSGDNGDTGSAGGSGVVIIRYMAVTPGVYTWTLEEGDGTTVLRATKHTSSVPTSGQRDDVVEVRTGTTSGTVVAKTKFHYVNQSWGEMLDSVIADPDSGGTQLTTSYTYYTTSTDLGNYQKVKSITYPTGNWVVYEYYNDFNTRGQLKYEYHPYLDSPTTAASYSTTAGRVIYYTYTQDWTGRYRLPSLRQESTTDPSTNTTYTTASTTWTPDTSTYTGIVRVKTDAAYYRDVSNSHTSHVEVIREDADPDFAGHPYLTKNADQTQTSWSVSRGTYNPSTGVFTVGTGGDHWREMKFNGSTNSSGADTVTGYDSQSCEPIYMIANKSTLDVTIRIAQGVIYRKATYVYIGSGNFTLMTNVDSTYDGENHLTQTLGNNGALTSYSYTDGQLTSTVDPTGIETDFTYDVVGRVATSVKKGGTAADITTTNTYDGANHVTQAVTSGGTHSLTSSAEYNLDGTQKSTTAPGSYKTTYAYTSSGNVVTSTLPGAASPTQVTEVYRDGHPKKTTGTAVAVAQYSGYTVNSGGTITQQINFGTSSSANLTKITTDWLGRTITETKPGWTSGSTVTRSSYYNNSGQLYKVTQPGLADTLYTYDTLGHLSNEGLDIDGTSGTLDAGNNDRITVHDWAYFSTGTGVWWRKDTTSTYPISNDSGTLKLVSEIDTQLSGFTAAGSGYTRLSRSDSYDVFGNVTTTYTEVANYGKSAVTTTVVPSSHINAVQTYYNGLLASSEDTSGVTTTYGYDDLGRQTTSVDPRTGTTTTAYVSGTSQVSTVTDPHSKVQATYAYNDTGRVSSVKNVLNKYIYYEYYPTGQKKHEWGDTTVPVEYAYDNWGHQITMATYRGGSGWTSSTWGTGTADYTLWVFDEGTGLLKEKYDAANVTLTLGVVTPISGAKKIAYTYNQAGQVKTRTWARGALTTYYYFGEGSGEPVTGELRMVDYADASMTDLQYTYNRLGKMATVTDSAGSRTFNYDLSGKLELQSEVLGTTSTDFYRDLRITYGYDTATGVVGRPHALELGTSTSATADQNLTYGYDDGTGGTGRLTSVAAGGQTFNYSYTSSSNLISTVANSALNYTDSRTYETYHDWTTERKTTWGSTPVTKAQFDYNEDDMGRTTAVTKTGELFGRYNHAATPGLKTSYGYSDRSEITSETSADLDSTPVNIAGRQDTNYAYDNIGNRTSFTHNSHTVSYTPNAVNQYDHRDVAGYFDVAGAAPGSTVTITTHGGGGSTDTASRNGQYFFDAYAMSNSGGSVYSQLDITDNTTPTPYTGSTDAFVAKTTEGFVYDADGNLSSDGRWDYTYDSENHLITVQTDAAEAPSALPAQKLTFLYDYLGRRISKVVQSGSGFGTTDLSLRFVYNEWNLMAELDHLASDAVVRSYYWGLDLSRPRHDAGGIGGLLMVQGAFLNAETTSTDTGKTLVAVYDAKGNLHGMLNTASVSGAGGSTYSAGSLVAAYEYDAFGNILRTSGPYAGSNPFCYSTKYTDIETGLVYYGLRYYSPSLGRFINKDPIEEKGGLNLYAFCGNNGINRWDLLGQVLDDPSIAYWNNYVNSHSVVPLINAGINGGINAVTSQYAKNLGVGSFQMATGGTFAVGAFVALTNPELTIPAGIFTSGVFVGGVLGAVKGFSTVASTITEGPTSNNTAYFQNLSGSAYGLLGQVATEVTGNPAYRNGGELLESFVGLGSATKDLFEAKGLLEQAKALSDTGSSAWDVGHGLFDFTESLHGNAPASQAGSGPYQQTIVSSGNTAALASISISNVEKIIVDPNTGKITIVTKDGGVKLVDPPTAAADPNNQAPIMGYNTNPPPPPLPRTQL